MKFLGTPAEQVRVAAALGEALLPIMELSQELIITHGNGPAVGKIMLRNSLARSRVTPISLDICVAHSQGGIAYLLRQAFENALRNKGNSRHVVRLLARVLHDELGWEMHEDSGRGWRYVVPSPYPRHVADISLVQAVAKSGAVVIPVIRGSKGQRRGIEAVIDKDRTSALMANVLGIGDLTILSPVSRVSINLGKANEQALDRVTLGETRRLHAEGHFLAGKHGIEDRSGDPVFGTRRPTRHDRAAG